MHAYVISSGLKIEPFGDPIGETLILDRPFAEVQEETLRTCGIAQIDRVERSDSVASTTHVEAGGKTGIPTGTEIGSASATKAGIDHPGEYLVLADNLFLSLRLLAEFIEKARALPGEGPVRLAVKKGLFTRLLAPIQETDQDEQQIRLPLWYNRQGVFTPERARLLEVDIDEDSYAGNFPKHMIKKEGYRFSVTSRPAVLVTNSLHLALANMAANFARLAGLKRMPLWRKIWTLAKARSLNKFKVLGAVSEIHPEAEVHPTAVIEGSVVEKGAKIGAYAVIKFSYVGENAFIDDHAGIKFSVIGREAYIANNCVMFFSVVYPRAFLISGPFQFSLFGYDSALMNAIPADYRLDGETISVKTSSGVKDTGLRFVGSVIGHRTKIAAGVIIAPGRMIPNDLLILPDPGRVIQSVPAGIDGREPLFLVGGRLVPFSQLSRKETSTHESRDLPEGAGSHPGVARGPGRQDHHRGPHHRRPGKRLPGPA